MKKIIILDFSTTDVHIFDFDENCYSNDDIVQFFEDENEVHDLNLSESNCQWMITGQLNLQIH